MEEEYYVWLEEKMVDYEIEYFIEGRLVNRRVLMKKVKFQFLIS
jgi:hypothetical protein